MLYIMRHGQTDWNLTNKIQGTADIPLNENGMIQAADAADFFAGLTDGKPQHIISSDLLRAAKTADIVGKKLNIRVEYDPRLREYDFGTLEGQSLIHLNETKLSDFNMNPTIFNAEPFGDAFLRIGKFLQELDFDKNILVVSHGGIMRFGMYYLDNGFDFDIKKFMTTSLREHLGNAGIIRVRSHNSKFEKVR